MKRIAIAIVVGLSLAVLAAGPEPAPPLTLKSVDGQTYSLAHYQGKLVFLTFFKEGCVPCKKEIPFLSQLAARYPDYLVVLGIGYQEKDPAKLKAVAADMGARFPVLVDSQGLVARGYRVTSLPFGALIDENGKIIGKWYGFQQQEVEAMVQAGVQRLSAQQRSTAITVGVFTEATAAAKQAGLGKKLQRAIAAGLQSRGLEVAAAGAASAYTVEGSVSKIGPVTGVSVRIFQTRSKLQMDEFSQSVSGEDYGPLIAELAAKIQKLP
jgi:peroxiredoxin